MARPDSPAHVGRSIAKLTLPQQVGGVAAFMVGALAADPLMANDRKRSVVAALLREQIARAITLEDCAVQLAQVLQELFRSDELLALRDRLEARAHCKARSA